jgi:hypothetical protein
MDNLFPRFIIHRRIRDEDEELNVDSQDIFLKQIQFSMKEEITLFSNKFAGYQNNFNSFFDNVLGEIKEVKSKID